MTKWRTAIAPAPSGETNAPLGGAARRTTSTVSDCRMTGASALPSTITCTVVAFASTPRFSAAHRIRASGDEPTSAGGGVRSS
jgi:hypothetical protein